MKILIAGGTGFIGSAATMNLLKKNHQVTILSRKPRQSTSQGPQYIVGDVTDPASLEKIRWDYDVVVMCVQFPNHPVENPKKGYTYEKVDGQGTENLCHAITRSTGEKPKRLIYLSGAGTGPDKSEPWFKAKWRGETAIKHTGIDYVILRPSWVYGPGDRSMSKFLAFTKLPVMPVIGDGKNRVSPVFIDDLAEIITQSAAFPKTLNATIDVGGPQALSMNEIQKAVLKFKNKNRPLLHQPVWLMKTVGAVLNATLPTPPLSPGAVDFINMNNPMDSKSVEKIFQIKMRPLEEGLKAFK